jgi:hypothetical protein
MPDYRSRNYPEKRFVRCQNILYHYQQYLIVTEITREVWVTPVQAHSLVLMKLPASFASPTDNR